MASIAVNASQPSKQQHPLRDPQFRLLWAGSSISLLGDQFYLVALPWVNATHRLCRRHGNHSDVGSHASGRADAAGRSSE